MLLTFSIILDDIVLPDGQTRMAWLGGGGPQTCFGMRLFTDEPVGIAAGVGQDMDLSWFHRSGIDTRGLRISAKLPTLRAWQIIEHDESRTQVWRVPWSAVDAHLGRSLSLLPEPLQVAKAFHLGIHPDHPDVGFMRELRALPHKPMVSVEVFKGADALPTEAALAEWLPLCGIFSANRAESISLGAPEDPDAAARWLCARGAGLAIVRCGAQGSVICEGDRLVRVPAPVAAPVMGSVGAGNAYCGAFLASYMQNRDIERAARAGAVAAKLLIERDRLPVVDDALRAAARGLMG